MELAVHLELFTEMAGRGNALKPLEKLGSFYSLLIYSFFFIYTVYFALFNTHDPFSLIPQPPTD